MLPQKEAEIGLAAALLRQEGESPDAALGRVAHLPIGLTEESILEARARKLISIVFANADKDIATSVGFAARITGIDEFDLRGMVSATDVDALPLYSEAVMYHWRRRVLKQTAEDAVTVAGQADPDEALDQITQQFADIEMVDNNRIGTIAERVQLGRQVLNKRQADLKAGKPRFSFPFSKMNDLIPTVLPGQVILITGKSKFGKTSVASQAFDYNVRGGLRGIYFHFEDTPEVMHYRRVARHMVQFLDARWQPLRPVATFERLLAKPSGDGPIWLTDKEMESVSIIEDQIVEDFGDRASEVYCGGWTMQRVCRTWRRLNARARMGNGKVDFVVIDYLNKAELQDRTLRHYGVYGGRGRDAELIKQTAEALGCVAILLQQESDEGKPYETRQSWQKSQAWLSIDRETYDDGSLSDRGFVRVMFANMGKTGRVPVRLVPQFMLWV
jgi:hypothetical protein